MQHAPNDLKKEGGRWLRALRDRRGLSQKDLAALVDVQNSVFISQLENGRVRIPPERYEQWAAAYGFSTYEFVKCLMSFYDPVTFRLLFHEDNDTNRTIDGAREVDVNLNMHTAVVTQQVCERYVDALYQLLGKKTAELEMLRGELDSAGSRRLKHF